MTEIPKALRIYLNTRKAVRSYAERAQDVQQRYGNEYETAARYGRSIPWLRKDRRKANPVFPFIKAPGDTSVKYDWDRLDALHASPEWSHGGTGQDGEQLRLPRRGRPKGSLDKRPRKPRRTPRASDPPSVGAPMHARDDQS